VSDNTIGTRVTDQDEERLEEFREERDLNQSQAVRRLVDRGLQYHTGWSMVRDIALAAALWAGAAVGGAVFLDAIPRALAMFSVVFAGVLLTSYGAYLARWRHRDGGD